MNTGVTDIRHARWTRSRRRGDPVQLRREPLTVICQVANVRAEREVHRQLGFSDALTFRELARVLKVAFGLPEEESPWHFFEHGEARGQRIDPWHQVAQFLWTEGAQVDFTWGLWDFEIVVAGIYPRDSGTPRALCVGGSGSFLKKFDLTAINAELTGARTIDAVLEAAAAPVRRIIERTKLYDFVPLLQALELGRPVEVPEQAREVLATLPREVTTEGKDAFWSTVLALACLGGAELADAVAETTMEALGWVDGEGRPLRAREIQRSCAESLALLESVGGYGPNAAAPVDRLDIYRALLRG